MYNRNNNISGGVDYGPEPFVVNLNKASIMNSNYRTALWTGANLQLTLMSIPVGGEIGLEVHPHLDQFLQLEDGCGRIMMGSSRDRMNCQTNVCRGYAVFVPAGTWHNLVNIGNRPIKLYSIYAPPQHPHGTADKTKADVDNAETHSENTYPDTTYKNNYDNACTDTAYMNTFVSTYTDTNLL